MQTRAPGAGNDRVGIAVKPGLLAEIRRLGIYPEERVLVAGNGFELIGSQRFVALDYGLAVCICRNDSAIRARFLTARGQPWFPKGRLIHHSISCHCSGAAS